MTKSDGEASLAKPYRPEDMVRALEIVSELVSTGKASRPYPKGLVVLNGSTNGPIEPNDLDVAKREVERLRAQQAALAAFGGYALGEDDLSKVLTEAARICANSLGVPYCKICRYRSDENDLLVEAGVGWQQGVVGRVVSVADASSPQGRAFSTQEPVICQDLRHDTSYILPAFYKEHGIVSTIDVIIKAMDGTPFGILEIDSPSEHTYDGHDVAFLTGFANVLAEAVSTSHRRSVVELSIRRMKDVIADRERLIAMKDTLLAEKNVMGKELQHRVRNNLQLIHSMLMRRSSARNGDASDDVSAIARRVMTLSQVYETLLGTGLSNTIDFGRYLEALCRDTEASLGGEHPSVKLVCHPKSLDLDLDTATGLGLAVSELIANSYSHAFPERSGLISVSVKLDGGRGSVIIVDDGTGFVEPRDSKSHGIGLVKRLMQQIDGSATLGSNDGTEWILNFAVPIAKNGNP